jgi:hypothetical protein
MLLMEKKTWTKPELIVHGSVEDVTAKKWGFGDWLIMYTPNGGGGTGS